MAKALKTSFGRKVAICLFAVLSVLLLVWQVSVVLWIFAGVLLAVVVEGVVGTLRRWFHLPRWLAVAITLTSFVGLLVGAGFLIGPTVGAQYAELSESMTKAVQQLEKTFKDTPFASLTELGTPREMFDRFAGGGVLTTVFSSAMGILSGVGIVAIVGLYLLVEPTLYIDGMLHLLPERSRLRAREISFHLAFVLRRWLLGRLAAMAAVGIMTGIGLWILGIPLAGVLGLAAALLSFIPVTGPIFSVVPAALLAFVEGWTQVAYVVALYVGVQMIEGNLLTPLIHKRSIALPPVALIVMQALLGALLGFFGLIVAAPLAVVGIVLVQTLYVQDLLHDHSIAVIGTGNNGGKLEGGTRPDPEGADRPEPPTTHLPQTPTYP